MRKIGLTLLALAVVAILIFGPALVGAALAAEGSTVPEPSGWASLEAAVIAFLLGLVTVIGGVILRYLPRLLSAWADLMIETTLTKRVDRVDEALTEAVAANPGAPDAAAADVVEKLPITIKRSGLDQEALARQAERKERASNAA